MAFSKRLGRMEGHRLAGELRALGFRVDLMPRSLAGTTPKGAPYRIAIWLPKAVGMTTEQSYLGCIRWVANLGWRLELVVPPLRTQADWDLARSQILGTQETLQATSDAWDRFQDRRVKYNWQSYLGLLASYYTGGMNNGTDQGAAGISGSDDSETFSGVV